MSGASRSSCNGQKRRGRLDGASKLTDDWVDREAEAFHAFGTLSAKYAQAREQNDLDTAAVICGEAVGLLRDRPTPESIVKSMAAQAADLLRKGGKLQFT